MAFTPFKRNFFAAFLTKSSDNEAVKTGTWAFSVLMKGTTWAVWLPVVYLAVPNYLSRALALFFIFPCILSLSSENVLNNVKKLHLSEPFSYKKKKYYSAFKLESLDDLFKKYDVLTFCLLFRMLHFPKSLPVEKLKCFVIIFALVVNLISTYLRVLKKD